MDVEEYMFERPKHTILDATVAVLVFSVVAVALTTAGFAWQGVTYVTPVDGASDDPVLGVSRREGLFEMCPTNSEGECCKRSFGYYPPDSPLEHYPEFSEIIEYRLATVICLAAALLFAAVSALFSAVFIFLWFRSGEDTMGLLVARLIISVILFCSGVLYELGIFFLHLTYMKEKTDYTDMIPFVFSTWSQELKTNTDIQYSICYYFFWVSLIVVHAAAVIFIASTVATTQYFGQYDESDMNAVDYNTRNSLPRFSVQEEPGIERIFLVDSP